MTKFFYTFERITLVPSNQGRIGQPSDQQKGGAASLVKLLSKGVKLLHDWGFERKVKAALESSESQIRDTMLPCGGVLVIIHYNQWRVQDFVGRKAKNFQYIEIGPSSTAAQSAVQQWLNRDQIYGVPEGWVRTHEFMWVKSKRCNETDLERVDRLSRTA